jgi:hypothetical protein
MALRIAFAGGPLDGSVMAAADERPTSNVCLDLPRYIFRATRHGREGASFDIYNPAELRSVAQFGRQLPLHQYRIRLRVIADDSTILVKAEYVGLTGRSISPTLQGIREWAGQGAAVEGPRIYEEPPGDSKSTVAALAVHKLA